MTLSCLLRRLRPIAIVAALLVAALPAAAQRVALVVGNGAYQAVPRLANPPRDAEEVSKALRALGFRVQFLRDANRAAMEGALRQFGRDAAGAEIATFFFAGHGMEVRGENLLIPVEARLSTLTDLDTQTLPVAGVMRAMQGAQARLIFLDACRDNPFAATLQMPGGTRSLARGLGRIETADLGTLVAFATAPGTVAADGDGRNSPFAAALVRHLPEPGLDIRQIMTRVRRTVVDETAGRQVPWDNSSLVADLVLRPTGGAAAQTPLAQAAPPTLTGPVRAGTLPAPGRDNWSATRRVAAEAGVPLPATIGQAAPERSGRYAHWVGSWYGGLVNGRRRIVIVEAVDPSNGVAEVVYAESDPGLIGSPTPNARFSARYPARVTETHLVFTTPWTFRLQFFTADRVDVRVTSPPGFAPATDFTHMMRRVE